MTTRPAAFDARGREHRVEHDRVVVTDDEGRVRRVVRLDDPLRPGFLRVAKLELPDGGSLRRAAFDVWAGHVRSSLWDGVVYELPFTPPRPLLTLLGIVGGLLVAAVALQLLVLWGATPRPTVRVDHGLFDVIGAATGLALLAGMVWLGLASALRAWLFRRGRFAVLDQRGLRVRPGTPPRPVSDVRRADYKPFSRLVRVEFESDGLVAHVPLARDTLPRLDAALAAMDERLVADLDL